MLRKDFRKKVSFSLDWLIIKIIEFLDVSDYDEVSLIKIKEEMNNIIKKENDVRENIKKTYGNNVKV